MKVAHILLKYESAQRKGNWRYPLKMHLKKTYWESQCYKAIFQSSATYTWAHCETPHKVIVWKALIFVVSMGTMCQQYKTYDNQTTLTGWQCFHHHTYEKNSSIGTHHLETLKLEPVHFLTYTTISSDLKTAVHDQWHGEWSTYADMKGMTTPQSLLPHWFIQV